MQKFAVTGMSCAACQARVEKAVSKVPGVTECSVSLLTNSMGVDGKVDSAAVIKAVEKAGYGASVFDSGNGSGANSSASENKAGRGAGNSATFAAEEELLKNKETPILRRRLIFSIGFLCLLMYISMGHMMWNWPLPPWFNGNHLAMGLLQMILALIIMFINRKFFISGFKSLIHGAPNMDTLVALGSGISFAYSTVILFLMTDAVLKADQVRIMHYMDNFYFEGAAMIVTLITVGKLLESVSKGRTTDALKSLMKLSPKTAVILKDGKEVTVGIEEVLPGDIFIVKPGENIPADGLVVEGSSAVNESALTGESVPVDKAEGDKVSAATINTSGFLKCRVTRTGKDTTLSQIIQMVSDAAATKAPIAKIADKVSGIFVPAVISIAIVTIIIWMICGADFSFALSKGITVLVVSCPCALGLATPVAIMVGNGIGAKNGILFKNSVSLENAGKTQIVALDKTGTITKGEPEVRNIFEWNKENQKEKTEKEEASLLQIALNLEKKSEHPLAKAIVKKAESENLTAEDLRDFEALGGKGVKAKSADGKTEFLGGNLIFLKENLAEEIAGDQSIQKLAEEIASQGQTPLLFAKRNLEKTGGTLDGGASSKSDFLGIIAVADVLKEESPKAINELKNMGIHVVMLTGDNQITAQAIAKEAGVDEVIAGVLPDGKEAIIKELKQKGKVCMVGDGINDAPALTRADIGIAIGAGTDVAIDAANIVLVKSRLDDVAAAIRLSRKTLKNIHENLFWAFFYNALLIPVAAGAWYHLFGLQMNPMLGAAAMSLSSFCVVTNALRLNLAKIRNPKHDKKIKNNMEVQKMEKTLKVEGMMCEHCEAHVKEALEKIRGVDSALADHTKGEVKVTLSKDVKDKDFEKAITKAGYKFIG
ncbi:MAG: heavy metal translocating P-type ATPase [Treponema sp.]|nr:heavy metal translocating P-type ATPase [Treponema sp.]